MTEAHKIVMAGNIVWSGFALPVFLIFVTILWKRIRAGHCGATERLMTGVALVAGASAVHRFYWTLWRYFLDQGEAEIAAWFVSNATGLTTLVALVAVGYALHLKPYFEGWLGPAWLPVVLAYGIGIAAVPFLL